MNETKDEVPQGCTHDCASCSANCGTRQEAQSLLEPLNEHSEVRNVIAVVSGKGGVGKSLVTALLAAGMRRAGRRVGVLDADITGPSVPRIFGLEGQPVTDSSYGLLPLRSAGGVEVMSVNLLLSDPTAPVLWRGPVLAGVVRQFWHEVCWGVLDDLFIDMPPGTGDVPLTVFQSLPVRGIVIVTSPQELVGTIVEKAVNMAELMGVPVLGLVENMSYYQCPDCGARHAIFGESHVDVIAARHGIPSVARIPLDPAIARAADAGTLETLEADWLDGLGADLLRRLGG
ncbi:MAG: Mrp/NBP35 family ATP-binding protein [Oscillospiraceae bacterium]|nr:Mrp/NBP35 family ATP-binding protein [Oscillospiraceae bacterium]